MTKLERVLYRSLYKKSFYEFAKYFWNVVDPQPFKDGVIVQFLCEVAEYLCRAWLSDDIKKEWYTKPLPPGNYGQIIDIRGVNKNKININIPPRHSKSMIFNVLLPVWLWLHHPIKAVSVSHTEGLAIDFNTKRQRLINSFEFQELYPEIKIVINSGKFLKDVRAGELYSINRNALLGRGADVIINDDLTNAETARKDMEEMNNAWSYYTRTMPSRINDIFKCIIFNIQQRLAPNDITGRLSKDKKLSEQYIFIVLEAIFSQKTTLVCPLSGRLITFEKGDFLWPERFGDYESLRLSLGEATFETQYLQKPIASDSTVIKKNMIIVKPITEVHSQLDSADLIYASHDFPVKDKEESDNFGSVLGKRKGSTLYILDGIEKKMAFVKSVEYVRVLHDTFPGIIQIIEDKANGSAVIQQLQEELTGIYPYNPGTKSKYQRLESASLYMDIKNVIFVADVWDNLSQTYVLSDNLRHLVERLLVYPFVEFDDVVDAFSQLVLFVFVDKQFSVYGRSFNDENITFERDVSNLTKTVFFVKEGDIWKLAKSCIDYSTNTIYIIEDDTFRCSVEEGLNKLKEFSKGSMVYDCSFDEGIYHYYDESLVIDRYSSIQDDLEDQVSRLSLQFAKKRIKLFSGCNLIRGEIDMFKYDKNYAEKGEMKFLSRKDGFISCIRGMLKVYGE